jgi:hypothetical protein
VDYGKWLELDSSSSSYKIRADFEAALSAKTAKMIVIYVYKNWAIKVFCYSREDV